MPQSLVGVFHEYFTTCHTAAVPEIGGEYHREIKLPKMCLELFPVTPTFEPPPPPFFCLFFFFGDLATVSAIWRNLILVASRMAWPSLI